MLLSFLFPFGVGLERAVQANSPVDCLSARGFSAEKRAQQGLRGGQLLLLPSFSLDKYNMNRVIQ